MNKPLLQHFRGTIHASDITQDTELTTSAHARYPGAHCAFFGVAGMVPLIAGSYALLLGPAICLYNAKLTIDLRGLTADPRPDNLLLVPFTQEDIIFGARDKIRKAVIEADDRYHPEALFVVTTCTQEIIGEDLDAIIDELRTRVQAKLLVVHTDNFTCEDSGPGIERTYLALADLMRPQPVEARTVNFLGLRAPGGRKKEPIRLLEEQGITVRTVIPSVGTPTEIGRAPGAALNIVLEHYALPLAEKMRDTFGTPFIYCEQAYSPEAIEAWYLRMAEALDINLASAIDPLKARLAANLAEKKAVFAGKTFILGVQQGRSFDLASLLTSIGMKPLLLYVNRFLPDDLADIQTLLNLGADPLVMKSGDAAYNERFLTELRPDFYIGMGDRPLLARLGIAFRNLMFAHYSPGFACAEQVLRLMARPQPGSEILYLKEQYVANTEATRKG